MKFNKLEFGKNIISFIIHTIKIRFSNIKDNVENIKVVNGPIVRLTSYLDKTTVLNINPSITQEVWVDQTNINSKNYGTKKNPYKRLEDAVYQCTLNGKLIVNLKNNYDLKTYIPIGTRRNIILKIGKGASLTSHMAKYNYTTYAKYGCFNIHADSGLTIILEDTDKDGNKENVNIIKLQQLPKPEDVEADRIVPHMQGIIGLASSGLGHTKIKIINKILTDKTIVKCAVGPLIYRAHWDYDNLLTSHIRIDSVNKMRMEFSKEVNQSFPYGFLYNTNDSIAKLTLNLDDNYYDFNNNKLSLNDVIVSLKKGIDGVPINLISNKIL